MSADEKVEGMLREILDGQKKQSDKLEAHGETLKEQGGAIEDINASVSDLKGQTDVNFTRLATQFEGLDSRVKEDREAAEKRAHDAQVRADKKELDAETKIGQAHQNNQQTDKSLGELAGQVKNHIEDDHATVAMQTRTDLDTHAADNNRHEGEAPGGGHVKTGATIAGGVGVGGGVIWGIIELAKVFTSAS